MIEIDGSYLEGGGQIVRTAIALSSITGKPCKITKIRQGRPNPGIKPQHLKSVETAAKMCNAEVKGLEIGSPELTFEPKEVSGGEYKVDIGTAGSITLFLQTLILPAIHADKEVTFDITGGTDVNWSSSGFFFKYTLSYFLKKIGIDLDVDIKKFGFYPKGGGRIIVKIKPCKEIKNLTLVERGDQKAVDIHSVSSAGLKERSVAERQVESFNKIVKIDGKKIYYVDTLSPGSSLHAHAHYSNCMLSSTVLGERKISAEKVGEKCATLLKKQIDSGACLDEWIGDQILPFLALANCDSKISVAEVTNHLKTNIYTIQKFLPVKFNIERNIISVFR